MSETLTIMACVPACLFDGRSDGQTMKTVEAVVEFSTGSDGLMLTVRHGDLVLLAGRQWIHPALDARAA